MKPKTHQPSCRMATKLFSIILSLFIIYFIPVIVYPPLLVQWKFIVVIPLFVIIYATQPLLSIREARQERATDKYTVWIITIISGIGQMASLLEWVYLRQATHLVFADITGLLFMTAGIGLRLYAIQVLGKYFTAAVRISYEHKIVDTGPYRYLRHPSYTGAFITMLGFAILFNSLTGFTIFGIGMLLVYYMRIKTEEATLRHHFGETYKKYQEHTWKMFPFIW